MQGPKHHFKTIFKKIPISIVYKKIKIIYFIFDNAFSAALMSESSHVAPPWGSSLGLILVIISEAMVCRLSGVITFINGINWEQLV